MISKDEEWQVLAKGVGVREPKRMHVASTE